ncbi:MAG: DNA mismatch repair protein MutS, partial [Holosporales bacterium]
MTATAAADAGLTPMMAQYRAMKIEHPECVLLFRLGDFYEIFFDDAPVVAKLLGIQLTRRNKQGGDDIPMCGIPWHQLDNYLPDLLGANLKVAICDQLETPEEAKRRGSKAPLRRGITRIVTPGTVVEETLIGAAGQKILASVCIDENTVGLAWGDIASGTLEVASLPVAEGLNLLLTLDPAEVLVPLALQHEEKLAPLAARLNPQADSVYNAKTAGKRLAAAYGMVDSGGFGSLPPLALAAAAGLTEYLQHTYRDTPIALKPPRLRQDSDRLILDAATVRNLELFTSLSGTA